MSNFMPKRRKEEFYCDSAGGGCSKYFLTYLRSSMFGNYTIQCPNCGHHHFRFIDKGLVTNDRHNERAGTAEIIVGLKATLRDTLWHNDPLFRRQQMKVYQGLS